MDGVNVKGGAVSDDELTQVLQCSLLHRRGPRLRQQELAQTMQCHRVVMSSHLGGILAQPSKQLPRTPCLFQKPLKALHRASSKRPVPRFAGSQIIGLYWRDEQQTRQPSRGSLGREQDSKHGAG